MADRREHPEARTVSRRATVGLAALAGGIAGTAVVGAGRVFGGDDDSEGRSAATVDAVGVGADPTGHSDSTSSLRDAIRAAEGAASSVVVSFAPGRYRVSPGALRTSGAPLVVIGDAPGAVTIEAAGPGDDPIIALSGSGSRVSGVQLDGRGTSGPLIAVDASYCTVDSVILRNAGTSAIDIGVNGIALVTMVSRTIIRSARRHGVETHTDHASTDGVFHSIDIGRSGAAGMRFASGGQVVSSVHSWASGRSSTASTSGFEIVGKYCQLDNCQAETNAGPGLLLLDSAQSTTVSGGRFWGNGEAGIDGGADHVAITGASIYRNGWAVADTSSPAAAGVVNRGGIGWRLTGLNIWEDDQPVPALEATKSEPRAIAGRTAGPTQSYAVADLKSLTDLSLVRFAGAGWASGRSLYRSP